MVRQTGAPQFDENGMLTRGTVIRHLMLPGLGGDTSQILRDIAVRWGDRVLVSLMRQYTPFDMGEYPRARPDDHRRRIRNSLRRVP